MPIQEARDTSVDEKKKVVITSQQKCKKGDLYVRFDISFPRVFTQTTKAKMLAALAANEATLAEE